MNSGRTLEEIKRLFNYLEKNKAKNDLQIIMTTEGCHGLYKLFIDCNKYQKMLEERINKAIEYIEKEYDDYEEFIYGKEFKNKLLKILKGEE